MMKLVVLITLCFSSTAFATPQKMEMIFLSPQKVSMILEILDRYQSFKYASAIAQNDMENCVPMGEGCFHPQLGFIEKVVDDKKPALIEEKNLELKTFNATDVNLVNCDKNNYFDIFCGKTGPDAKFAETEIWFDVSSSLRTVDYNKDPEQCSRRSFMERVQASCKNKLKVSVYNTSIKEVSEASGVCLAYGTNEQSRLLSWMKESKAKHLLIVTDIDEMSNEMRDFLEINGAKMIGDGVKAFTSVDLINYADDFAKLCK
jgi:hypothetical protein